MHSVQAVVDEQRSLGLLSNDSSIASRQSLLSLSLLGMENTLKLLLLGNSVLVRIPSRVRQLPCYVSVSIPCTATLPHFRTRPPKALLLSPPLLCTSSSLPTSPLSIPSSFWSRSLSSEIPPYNPFLSSARCSEYPPRKPPSWSLLPHAATIVFF